MNIELKSNEIYYLIKQMMTYNKDLCQSDSIAEYILTHHKLNNLDYLFQIITDGYKTISSDDIYNSEYLNNIVIVEKVGDYFMPTVCQYQHSLFVEPNKINENDCIVSKASIDTIAKCLTIIDSDLMVTALKMEGLDDYHIIMKWEDLLKRMHNYRISDKQQYLAFNYHERFIIVEVSESGNALLIKKNSVEDYNGYSLPKWKEQEEFFEMQQKMFYDKNSNDIEDTYSTPHKDKLKSLIARLNSVKDSPKYTDLNTRYKADKDSSKDDTVDKDKTTEIYTDNLFYKKFDTDEEMNEYIKTHFPNLKKEE